MYVVLGVCRCRSLRNDFKPQQYTFQHLTHYTITVQALYDLYIEEFFAVNPHLKGRCADLAVLVNNSCIQSNQQEMMMEKDTMISALHCVSEKTFNL